MHRSDGGVNILIAHEEHASFPQHTDIGWTSFSSLTCRPTAGGEVDLCSCVIRSTSTRPARLRPLQLHRSFRRGLKARSGRLAGPETVPEAPASLSDTFWPHQPRGPVGTSTAARPRGSWSGTLLARGESAASVCESLRIDEQALSAGLSEPLVAFAAWCTLDQRRTRRPVRGPLGAPGRGARP